MDNQDKKEGKEPLKPHPIVEKLAGDPANPAQVTQIAGYVGRSTRPGYARLYETLDLDAYVDIPEAAILHSEAIPETEMDHGGTRVWVDAYAQVLRETRQTIRTEARFLEGTIASANLQQVEAPAYEEMGDEGFGGPVRAADRYAESVKICRLQTYAWGGCPIVTKQIRTLCPGTCVRSCNGNTCEYNLREELKPGPFGDDVAVAPTLEVVCQPTRLKTCLMSCATCLRTCGGTCAVSCATCLRTCGGTCAVSCVTCIRTCGQTCKPTCAASCLTCVRTCGATCMRTCLQTCGPTCVRTCGASCVRTCGPTCLPTKCCIVEPAPEFGAAYGGDYGGGGYGGYGGGGGGGCGCNCGCACCNGGDPGGGETG